MAHKYKQGSNVKWKWGKGCSKGHVLEIHDTRVHKQLKGTKVIRNGTKDNPAYLIKQDDGSHVLKLESELQSDDTTKEV
jgi:hypothetical protein